MFVFLTRLGRLVVGIPVVIAVTTILGINTLTSVPVAHHQNTTQMACAVSSAGVGKQLSITGSGYAPSTGYLVDITWPAGNTSGQSTTTDASGHLSAWNYAYYAGTYSVAVATIGAHSTVVARCSTSVV
jgi:hypothetical protein